MIGIIGTPLYQWDTSRSVKVTDIEADRVHFANKGDSKAVIMEIADSQAKIPDYLLQTGKQLCVYAVKNGTTVESKTFFVSVRERPENYVYDDDQRNFIYALITDAQEATSAANVATQNALDAANRAGQATAITVETANVASEAAKNANNAANTANEAAFKAANTAKSLMVVGKAYGTSIHLDDAIEQYLVGCRIFGKTTQDGIPTPEAPVDMVSVGDGGNVGVTVVGKNLVDITKATRTGTERIEVKDDTIVIDAGSGLYGVQLNGVVLEVGRTYTMSVGNVSQHDVNFGFRIIYDDGTSSNTFGDNSVLTTTVTKPIKSVYFYVGYGMLATSQIVVKQLQIEEGAVRTAYEPYHIQSLTIATPNGLPGIPVTTGGNYTDANGQQWICDEIDFARGVYVSRVGKDILDGVTTVVAKNDSNSNEYLYYYRPANVKQNTQGYCTHFRHSDILPANANYLGAFNLTIYSVIYFNGYGIVSGDNGTLSNPSEFNNWINAQYNAGTPVTVLYILATPIETPLTEEELAAYAALHTYRDHTTVSNDASAHMELEYVMDAKKYIDSLMTGTIIPASVE